MNAKRTKLELTWIGKDDQPRLEPRILLEDRALSYHASRRRPNDTFDNRLIFGDNLLALKSLESEFAEKMKCIYIDPPFNTQQSFEFYDDGLEHSLWLSLIRDRVEALHRLLAPDGTLAVHIDDNELGYLIVLLDEVFGRRNRTYVVTFKQSSSSGPKAVNPGLVSTSSYILLYAKDKRRWKPKKVFASSPRDARYNRVIANYDDDPLLWKLIGLREAVAQEDGVTAAELKARHRTKAEMEERVMQFVSRNADRVVRTARIAAADIAQTARPALEMSEETSDKVFRGSRNGKPDLFFLNGEQVIFYSSKLREIDGEIVTAEAMTTIWDDLLSNNLHNEGGVAFPNGKKPEGLIKRILDMTTDEGDWVLDSFAGSGTTPATAHKMRRRWIAVELQPHCYTHIVPRMRRVVDGADPSGVTKAVSWNGGGGFRFYKVAPSLLQKDCWNNWVINKEFNPEMLAEAVCKLENFTYAPSEDIWWQHGHSTERDFIYATTQTLTQPQLAQISEDVGPDRSLLICCGSFRANAGAFPNLTIRKIPKTVMYRCEWGRDDYSLAIGSLPEPSPDQTLETEARSPRRRAGSRKTTVIPTLFALDADNDVTPPEES